MTMTRAREVSSMIGTMVIFWESSTTQQQQRPHRETTAGSFE